MHQSYGTAWRSCMQSETTVTVAEPGQSVVVFSLTATGVQIEVGRNKYLDLSRAGVLSAGCYTKWQVKRSRMSPRMWLKGQNLSALRRKWRQERRIDMNKDVWSQAPREEKASVFLENRGESWNDRRWWTEMERLSFTFKIKALLDKNKVQDIEYTWLRWKRIPLWVGARIWNGLSTWRYNQLWSIWLSTQSLTESRGYDLRGQGRTVTR